MFSKKLTTNTDFGHNLDKRAPAPAGALCRNYIGPLRQILPSNGISYAPTECEEDSHPASLGVLSCNKRAFRLSAARFDGLPIQQRRGPTFGTGAGLAKQPKQFAAAAPMRKLCFVGSAALEVALRVQDFQRSGSGAHPDSIADPYPRQRPASCRLWCDMDRGGHFRTVAGPRRSPLGG